MSRTKSRTAILVTLLGAFSGIKGDLTEEEADLGLAIIENEYQGDLDAVAAALKAEMKACELACRVSEKG